VTLAVHAWFVVAGLGTVAAARLLAFWAIPALALIVATGGRHAARAYRRCVSLQAPDSLQGATLEPDGRWELRQRDGRILEGRLDAATTRIGCLVFMVWRVGRRRRHAVVDAAAMSRQDFRRLVMRLEFDATL
jgi:hypothetical protein